MTDSEAREMARSLVRDSIIEDAAAQYIAQILKHVHQARIVPLKNKLRQAEKRNGDLVVLLTGVITDLRSGVHPEAIERRIEDVIFREDGE